MADEPSNVAQTDDAAALLADAPPVAAFLATAVDDRPLVAPVWYRSLPEEDRIEVVTTGRKLAHVRENPRVSLSVHVAEAGIPEWTVTVLGTASIVDDADETDRARRAINRKYGADEDEWAENVLVRIDVGSATARVY